MIELLLIAMCITAFANAEWKKRNWNVQREAV
jgi:hypothetical protein